MRSIGWLIVAFAATFGLYALFMDTSVSAGAFGRVNNIGLMNDKQNFIMFAGAAFIGGLLMVIFGGDPSTPAENLSTVSKGADPFDEADVARENERKRYAMSLGVTRENGLYCFKGTTYSELEQAVLDAEAERELNPHDPGSHFLG